MSTLDEKLAGWRRETETAEPSPQTLALLAAAAAGSSGVATAVAAKSSSMLLKLVVGLLLAGGMVTTGWWTLRPWPSDETDRSRVFEGQPQLLAEQLDGAATPAVPWLVAEPVAPASPVVRPPVAQASGAAPVERPVPPSPDATLELGVPYRLDRDGIRQAMGSAMSDIERCYDDWLQLQPTLGGKLTLQLLVDGDGPIGRVSHVSVSDGGVGNPAFEGCVLSVVSELRFEAPHQGTTTITYPFSFVAPPLVPEALRPVLASLCQRLSDEAVRAEYAQVSLDDLLTVVLASLERQTPALKAYTAELLPGDVPPLQRKRAFVRGLSTALGAEWDCPAFERLWVGARP